jgi:alpha-ketoglutarate-dependent taurine dioxygenase
MIQPCLKTTPFDRTFGTTVEAAAGERPDDLDRDQVIELIKSSGVVFFRGFGIDPPVFERFTNRFATEFMNYKGGRYFRRAVNDDGTITSVAYHLKGEEQDTFPLPLHGEMYYLDARPVLIWFLCVRPALRDGETTVCDGAELYRQLSDSTRKLFERQRLKYVRFYPESEWTTRFQTRDLTEAADFCTKNGMRVVVDPEARTLTTEYLHPATITSRWHGHTVFINNILTVTAQERLGVKGDNIVRLEDGSKIPESVIADIESCCERLTRPIPWQAGDFAVVDNTRVLHGRRQFDDNVREIYSRMVKRVDF